MRLNRVPALTGLVWIRQGIRTFLRQPLALAGLFFMFLMVMSVLSLVPLLGGALALALLPAATLGLMAATREADSGTFPMPTVLASAFQASRERVRAMLVLGGLYAIGSLVVMALTMLIVGDPTQALQEGAEMTEEMLRQPIFLERIFVSLLLYFPLGLLFWHAPALVHWHGVSPIKSLFFSAVACWANKGAMVVYLVGWGGVFMATSFAMVSLAALFGPQLLSMVIFPMAMLMSAMFFTSQYYTFRDSFQD